MAKGSLFPLSFCFLLLCGGCLAQVEQQQPWRMRPQGRFREQSECRVESLRALEPNRRVESEAGATEYWDENNEQFECAGVAATRHTIAQRGLLLPSFSNAPQLIYIVQGRGLTGAIIPGCPESFQSTPQSRGDRMRRSPDQHQRIRQFRQGDIIALPAGVAHWCYNDGETPVIAVQVIDTSNNANQLDQNLRDFHLAGNPRQPKLSFETSTREERPANNILSGFDVETLAEAFGVSTETARKLQSPGDKRGHIVHVEDGLQVPRPSVTEEEEQQREEEQMKSVNGLEETFCSMRLKHNIGDPEGADVYSPQAGRITNLNSQKLPILRSIQLSAKRGVLYKNAMLAPHWTQNAHSVVYCTGGSARVQIVGDYNRPVFDGELQRGQMIIVPHNFAVVKQAGERGFEWIAVKTIDNAVSSPIVGKSSVMRGIPEAVLMSSYRIPREEARRLKNNRGDEIMIFAPRSQGRASA